MKLIKSSVELYPQEDWTLEGIYKQIEKCARISYKSEDKIKEGSSKEFVDRLIKAGHHAPLEFGTVYLKIPISRHSDFERLEIKFGRYSRGTVDFERCLCYITTNFRVIIENRLENNLQYLCAPTEYHVKRQCVKFTLSRSIAQEFTRHRVFSYMMESQRFVNYSKSKHGGEITYIIPHWAEIPEGSYHYWDGDWCDIENMKVQISDDNKTTGEFLRFLNNAEKTYIMLLNMGLKPQEAREVLPNATKTELVMCGFEDDFEHFFDLRMRGNTGAPHPDALKLATEAYNLLYT